MKCPHFNKDRCDKDCITYVAAHEASEIFEEYDAKYYSETAFDFFRFCDFDDDTVKLSVKTWKNLRELVTQAQHSAYLSGFFDGWERLDYEQATLDWLDGAKENNKG